LLFPRLSLPLLCFLALVQLLLLLLSLLLPLLLLLMLLLLLSVEAIVWLSRCLEALSSRHSGSGAPLSAGTPDRNMQSLFVNGVV